MNFRHLSHHVANRKREVKMRKGPLQLVKFILTNIDGLT